MQEWEAFTGLIVTDTKHESDKDIPNWIEPDRTPALLLLKVAGPFELILLSTSYILYIFNDSSTILRRKLQLSLWNVCVASMACWRFNHISILLSVSISVSTTGKAGFSEGL